LAHDYAIGMGGDTGDPLWTPPTFPERWPETVPQEKRHLINPDLLTIKRARDVMTSARLSGARDRASWADARSAWRLAHVRARRTSLVWETRYLILHARAFLEIMGGDNGESGGESGGAA